MRSGALDQLSIVDVPSMLLYCLDLPIPTEFEGRFPSEVFEDSMLSQQPVRGGGLTEASVDGAAMEEEFKLSPEDEATMVERLRALGYIE